MLFVCAVVTRLIPTVTSSMPEKGRFAIVEKYGDCVIAVRRFSLQQRSEALSQVFFPKVWAIELC